MVGEMSTAESTEYLRISGTHAPKDLVHYPEYSAHALSIEDTHGTYRRPYILRISGCAGC